jgi:hypothetical protein
MARLVFGHPSGIKQKAGFVKAVCTRSNEAGKDHKRGF